MRRATALLISLCFVMSCSSPPNDEVIIELIQDSMKKEMPLVVIGNALGGKLVKLEEIDIEKVEKKEWEPNALGKAFGKKPYTYWAVTARVKGTGRVKEPFSGRGMGELRGFHARHVWVLKKEENGSWSVTGNNFTQGRPAQPANPSWWVVGEQGQNTSTQNLGVHHGDSATNAIGGHSTTPSNENEAFIQLTTQRHTEYECNLTAVNADRQEWLAYADKYPKSSHTPKALGRVIYLYLYPTQCDITKKQKHLYRLAALEAYDKLSKQFPKSEEIPIAKRYLRLFGE